MNTAGSEITEVTRRAIIDLFAGESRWAGTLQDGEFLARLYELTKLPSTDYRFSNAAGDIYQHRVRNDDWTEDWVFYDPRFNLLHAPDEALLRFLCETVHPVVRPDSTKAEALAEAYNVELRRDGWEIAKVRDISGRPVFGARRLGGRETVFEAPTGWQKVDRQIQEMRQRLDSASTEEQCQSVGLLCREILISVAQAVFNSERHAALDHSSPSSTDAKRMLESIFEAELRGSSNDEARAHAKAAVRLALALQHKRTADVVTAALCAEGTLSVVNLLAILSGRRRQPAR